MSRPLYVTSFAADMYEASGKALIESYDRLRPQGKLLVCYEPNGTDLGDKLHESPVDAYNLENDAYLRTWLRNNADIIPDYLGGQAKECNCKGREERHCRHQPLGCHWSYMNRNASRFFRKVACWKFVADSPEYRDTELVLWVDSDCVFLQKIQMGFLSRMADDYDVVYCRGRRESPESGVLLFNFGREGRSFIWEVCKRFDSREYLHHYRWDDGYVVGRVIDDSGDWFSTYDLVDATRQKGNHVVPQTVWKDYIEHRKGTHSSTLGIVW